MTPGELDQNLAPKELATPLPADSSQLSAVIAAAQGRDFVLIGPPGTGKSQTIANIICQCLAQGKTVLFVAEKAAALDVVQRRLEAHGLGDAVLELHSNKTDRKRVLTQLGRGWDRASTTSEQDWLNITGKLRIKLDQLNTYVDALHAKGPQGFSVFDAISWTEGAPKGLKLSFADKDAHDQRSFARLLDIAEDLGRTHAAVGGGGGWHRSVAAPVEGQGGSGGLIARHISWGAVRGLGYCGLWCDCCCVGRGAERCLEPSDGGLAVGRG